MIHSPAWKSDAGHKARRLKIARAYIELTRGTFCSFIRTIKEGARSTVQKFTAVVCVSLALTLSVTAMSATPAAAAATRPKTNTSMPIFI